MTLKEATKKILNETATEVILKTDETPTFFQFVCLEGGSDAVTYRVYKSDGSIYVK